MTKSGADMFVSRICIFSFSSPVCACAISLRNVYVCQRQSASLNHGVIFVPNLICDIQRWGGGFISKKQNKHNGRTFISKCLFRGGCQMQKCQTFRNPSPQSPIQTRLRASGFRRTDEQRISASAQTSRRRTNTHAHIL